MTRGLYALCPDRASFLVPDACRMFLWLYSRKSKGQLASTTHFYAPHRNKTEVDSKRHDGQIPSYDTTFVVGTSASFDQGTKCCIVVRELSGGIEP